VAVYFCVGLTQCSVIRIIHLIHRNVGLKCFFRLPKCLLISLVFSYIYISQGSVERHLRCEEIYTLLQIFYSVCE